MMTQEEINRFEEKRCYESKLAASKLLALPEAELYSYWLTRVAVSYHHGLYLANATERSKKMLFTRWRGWMREFSEAPVDLGV